MGELTNLIQNFGLAVAILVVCGFASWRMMVWFGSNVVKPITERHMQFISKLESNVEKQADTLGVIADTLRKVVEIQARQEDLQEQTARELRLLAEKVAVAKSV